MCNDAKKRAIYAVSKQIGIDVDWNELDKLTDEQASLMIDELKLRQQQNGTTATGEGFSQARFGMVVKIVFNTYPYEYLKQNRQVFAQHVKDVYELVTGAEKHLKTPSSPELTMPPITVRQPGKGGPQ